MRKTSRRNSALIYVAAFVLPALILLWVFQHLLVTPFGDNSIGTVDANIQYVDYFRYYRNVLLGNDSLAHSFSNFFGESGVALFAYYLASPLNLLILLFPVGAEHTFLTVLVLLKTAFAGLAMAMFLRCRFREPDRDLPLHPALLLSLSTGYALMQYDIAQSANIMWLDGAILLPLIVLGLHRLVTRGTSLLYVVALGASVFLNWYTGYFNCLAVLVLFVWELVLAGLPAKQCLQRLGSIAGHTVVGLLLSAGLFLPTILELKKGKGTFDGEFEWVFNANVLNLFDGFTLGSLSAEGKLSLFCGSLALVGALLYFTDKAFSVKERVSGGLAFLLLLMLCYYQPLEFVGNGFREITRYWYRYAYLLIFFLLYFAAMEYTSLSARPAEQRGRRLAGAAAVGGILLLLPNYINGKGDITYIAFTVCFLGAEALLLSGVWRSKRAWQSALAGVLLLGAVSWELGFNGMLVYRELGFVSNKEYQSYVEAETAQVAALKAYDDGFYRTSEQTYRRTTQNGTTLYYNEPLASGFPGITHYSSTAQNRQLQWVYHCGYSESSLFTVSTTRLLPAEALTGVKYMTGKQQYEGFAQTCLPQVRGKSVWQSSYALPAALVVSESARDTTALHAAANKDAPLKYQEAAWSALAGKDVTFFQPVDYKVAEKDGMAYYTVSVPYKEGVPIYGRIRTAGYGSARLRYRDRKTSETKNLTTYPGWLSPKIFEVPKASWRDSDKAYHLTLDYAGTRRRVGEAEFYQLDTAALQAASQELAKQEPAQWSIENGKASASVEQAAAGQYLFLSIPYDEGWTVTVNGQPVEAETFADCFFLIPLDEGDNQVELQYHVPGLKEGICLSVLGAVLAVAGVVVVRKRRKKESDA